MIAVNDALILVNWLLPFHWSQNCFVSHYFFCLGTFFNRSFESVCLKRTQILSEQNSSYLFIGKGRSENASFYVKFETTAFKDPPQNFLLAYDSTNATITWVES